MLRYTFYIITPLLIHFSSLCAQVPIAFGTSLGESVAIDAPRGLNASDGIYDRFVLLRWEAVNHAKGYKVFRANDEKGSGLQQLGEGIQHSTWFCDYSAVPGVSYFYAIATQGNQGKASSLSPFDKGYIRNNPVAEDPLNLLSDNSAVAVPLYQRFLMIADAYTDANLYAKASTVTVTVDLQNIFTKETPRTELRYYLSNDAKLHWDDQLLLSRYYSSLPGEKTFSLTNKVQLPRDLIAQEYYIIIVAAPEGEVMRGELGSTIIKIH